MFGKSDFFFPSISRIFFFTIFVNFVAKVEPKWIPKSVENQSTICTFASGLHFGASGAFCHHFGAFQGSILRAVGSFWVSFWCPFDPFWCPFGSILKILSILTNYFSKFSMYVQFAGDFGGNSICTHRSAGISAEILHR